MSGLDNFFSKTYEKNINNNMLYYSYKFPKKEVFEYVRQIINTPIYDIIDYILKHDILDPLTAKDIFQFSSFKAATDDICLKLEKINNPGINFIDAGKLLLDDNKKRNDIAYRKYGENHLKTAESVGLLYELTRTYFLSCIGIVYLELNLEERKKFLIRLFLRNKLIFKLIKSSSIAQVDVRQLLYMLSDKTYNRRRSNLKTIMRFLQSSDEFDFKPFINNIIFI